MTTYKEVFQLAQDKGYKLSDVWLRRLNPESEFLELALIQKWLRDEHKIFAEAQFVEDGTITPKYCYHYGTFHKNNWKFPRLFYNTYEQALLEGIFESLKLI